VTSRSLLTLSGAAIELGDSAVLGCYPTLMLQIIPEGYTVISAPETADICLSQGRILVVDDDDIQRSVLQAVLEASGFEVETVSSGRAAVQRILDGKYDLVLLDYQLPEIDGLTIARLVRGLMGEVARPRLIALTALTDIVIGRELMSGKVFDNVVSKSVDLPELLAILTRYLRSTRKALALKSADISGG
jgi:CheY-like chemotaxis protein